MQTYPAKVAKDKFGEMVDTAQREPVEITRNGRTVAYVISPKEFEAIDTQRRIGGARASQRFEKIFSDHPGAPIKENGEPMSDDEVMEMVIEEIRLSRQEDRSEESATHKR